MSKAPDANPNPEVSEPRNCTVHANWRNCGPNCEWWIKDPLPTNTEEAKPDCLCPNVFNLHVTGCPLGEATALSQHDIGADTTPKPGKFDNISGYRTKIEQHAQKSLDEIDKLIAKQKSEIHQLFVDRDMLGHLDILGRDLGQEALDVAYKTIDTQAQEHRAQVKQYRDEAIEALPSEYGQGVSEVPMPSEALSDQQRTKIIKPLNLKLIGKDDARSVAIKLNEIIGYINEASVPTKNPAKDDTLRTWGDIRASSDPIDRLACYLNGLSPHNLWKGVEVLREALPNGYAPGGVEAPLPDSKPVDKE